MTSRERVRRAFAHEIPDRVPIDYLANPDIDRRLKAHFNLSTGDDEGLRQALGVYFLRSFLRLPDLNFTGQFLIARSTSGEFERVG